MPRIPARSADLPLHVTIRDVAARAGVSVATVSRVFNQKGPIRQETLRRVMDVAGEMQYVPHAGARSLSTRSTRTIGVVLPDLHGEFFSEVIRGIDLAARESGYHLLLSGSHADRDEMRAVVQAVRGLVDGLIIMSPDLDPRALCGELPLGVPAVLLNAKVDGRPSITIDNSGGARDMVRHLAKLGHKQIAFITGPARNADAEQRRRGFRAGAKAHGIEAIEIAGDFTEDSGYEAAKRIVKLEPRPTAVFAANDSMAIGALSGFRDARVRVPEQMALVGFDDIPIARFLDPPLTTVKVPIAELGRRGLQLLLSHDGNTQSPARLETSLVVRRSCGAERTGNKNQKGK
ncbi:MAG TPA: LacI family DNA-binding transcriptional regulator [Thermoanaerobaculia bacterium]|jgi:LacI family transcriptional regulator